MFMQVVLWWLASCLQKSPSRNMKDVYGKVSIQNFVEGSDDVGLSGTLFQDPHAHNNICYNDILYMHILDLITHISIKQFVPVFVCLSVCSDISVSVLLDS